MSRCSGVLASAEFAEPSIDIRSRSSFCVHVRVHVFCLFRCSVMCLQLITQLWIPNYNKQTEFSMPPLTRAKRRCVYLAILAS